MRCLGHLGAAVLVHAHRTRKRSTEHSVSDETVSVGMARYVGTARKKIFRKSRLGRLSQLICDLDLFDRPRNGTRAPFRLLVERGDGLVFPRLARPAARQASALRTQNCFDHCVAPVDFTIRASASYRDWPLVPHRAGAADGVIELQAHVPAHHHPIRQ